MVRYFAYASSLMLSQIREITENKKLKPKQACYMNDTKIVFPVYSKDWGGGTASFSEGYGHRLWGAIFEVSAVQLRKLDAYEGVTGDAERDPYTRIKVDLTSADGKAVRGVYTYKARRELALYYPPSERYLKAIEKGVKECGIPESYVMDVRNMLAKL